MRLLVGLWSVTWTLLARPTPKPLNKWRLWLLRRFGASIGKNVYVAPDVRIKMPWQLTMADESAIAYGCDIYNLGHVRIGHRTLVNQQTYVCGGTHDLNDPNLPLMVGDITIEDHVFIGTRALILPGVCVRTGAVVGAGSVVTRDVPAWTIVAGNPAKPIRPRDPTPFTS